MSTRTTRPFRPGLQVGLLVLASAALVACAKTDSGLTGETWAVSMATAIGDQASLATLLNTETSTRYTVRFDASGTYTGMADCNQIAGSFSMSGQDKIEIKPGPTTLMACPNDPAGSLFASALARATTYAVPSTGHLTLTMAGGGSIDFVPLLSLPPLPASASPEPSSSVGASASASASATASVSASPKATATPVPTSRPSAAPTATPAASVAASATPVPSPIPLGASCTSPNGSVVVAYPKSWFTAGADVPQFTCAVFDRVAIVIDPVTGMPSNGPVRVVSLPTITYTQATTALTNPVAWTQVVTKPAIVAGLPATLITAAATGNQSLAAGTTAYTYVVDQGTQGVLMIDTTAPAGDANAADNQRVVDAMAGKILIKTAK